MTRAVLLLALLASACASAQPAPIQYGRGAPSAGRTQAPPPRVETRRPEVEAPPARPHPQTSEPDWAEGEGTPLYAYALRPEDAQPYDPARLPRTHRVDGDESLYEIAARYQVPLRALIDQNQLQPPYALARGRELQLPPPRLHRVARGETLQDVARRYNVDTRSLALLNRMPAPYSVRTGDVLVLPAVARAPDPTPPPSPTPAPAAAGPTRFQWPLRGEIVARYGAQPGGVRIDGIEIAGREGAEIGAAGDGEVVYAGADLPAYGTLVLVRHADGYVTAYGYARRALVREGQSVRAGQAIAELGARPDGRARLLFQVRRGADAVDPAPLLGSAG
ncbi:MAG: peptidoglycan DD-metalloendopeptidase family protein [Hyphomonadaceae bacterium]